MIIPLPGKVLKDYVSQRMSRIRRSVTSPVMDP
jgi:hypothetical protein